MVSAGAVSKSEEQLERALRPKMLEEYVGQQKAREQLEIFIGAARKRGEALDHVLLFGPRCVNCSGSICHSICSLNGI